MIANYVKVGLICLCPLGMSDNSVAQTSSTPIKNMVRAGKIRYIGCSNFSGWHLMKSLAVSDRWSITDLSRFPFDPFNQLRRAHMQQKIVFKSKGLNCSGLFYLPDNYSATEGKRLPAIAMAHGIGTLKEMGLPQYAERFADAGFAVLLFDFRNLGESEGTPREQVFAEDQQEDYRNAITWLQLQPQIDPERIGVWGFSFSGGHVLQVAAFDRRIKCVVAQVPAVSGFLVAQRSNTPSDLYGVGMMLSQDRIRRYETGEVNYLPFVAPPGQPCFFPSSEEAREFFEAAQVASEGRFENRITFESLERLSYFEPAVRIDAISPTPLRMILAKKDFLIPMDIALDAYARAHEPKSLVFLEGGHLGKSEGDDFETASAAARDWFVQWLKPCNVEAAHRPVVDGIPQISVQELKRKLDAKEDVFVLDVREPHEHKIANLGAPLIPVGDIERRASELADKKNSEIIVYCKAGVRSQKAALALKQAGFTNVSNLTGGILAWAEKIVPSLPKP